MKMSTIVKNLMRCSVILVCAYLAITLLTGSSYPKLHDRHNLKYITATKLLSFKYNFTPTRNFFETFAIDSSNNLILVDTSLVVVKHSVVTRYRLDKEFWDPVCVAYCRRNNSIVIQGQMSIGFFSYSGALVHKVQFDGSALSLLADTLYSVKVSENAISIIAVDIHTNVVIAKWHTENADYTQPTLIVDSVRRLWYVGAGKLMSLSLDSGSQTVRLEAGGSGALTLFAVLGKFRTKKLVLCRSSQHIMIVSYSDLSNQERVYLIRNLFSRIHKSFSNGDNIEYDYWLDKVVCALNQDSGRLHMLINRENCIEIYFVDFDKV